MYDKLKNLAYINELPFEVVLDDENTEDDFVVANDLEKQNKKISEFKVIANPKNRKDCSQCGNNEDGLKKFLSNNLFGIKSEKFVLNRKYKKVF